ncbi:sugar ABC transporter ATP-binding protein [Catenuloplanes atrovinosus]|uniref:Ribose transport system ATP-binding protein n=1 Tax=Catenuloplanes atrovinosus TaxID=137266 RepID=A0AAE3YPW4_9ACTN|nr:sugar ABC transporter ATP-binding protein [Catenuloplanes atrovinosus]MDR7277072.1 ribose transport system ATP-binding protein [Catenuloplanes atrovinosus]
MTLLLEATGVRKSFPGVRALSDMHLELRHDEVLALVGENGAGKSTLMKLLTGALRPDAGTFRLDGEEFDPRRAEPLGISIIHQEFNLMPDLTVAQNVLIGREPRTLGMFIDERRLNARTGELLDRLGLPLDPRARVGDLPVARQQLVEIAKALSHEARVLIMDEPTAALNDAEVAVLHGLIRRFTGPRTGVIYISHRMEELTRVSDRITVIRDGRHIGTVETRGVELPRVISMMVGRELDLSATPVGVRDDRAPVLSVRGLATKRLLKDITFEVREGEILGIAGLMGAGRTELGRAIAGADPISAGTISVRGRPVRITSPARAAALGIGYLSEDRKRFGLLLDQSVAANIAVGSLGGPLSRAGFVDDGRVRATAQRYIDALRIKTAGVRQEARHLSGGNQQKVVIARWLARDCDLLIVDEPTRGIDVGAKEEIYQLLNELAGQGRAIVMISSELPEILRMAHRVLVLSGGRLTGELSAAEATQERIMHLATRRGV